MDGDTTERLSQESQCPDAKEHGLLARASAFARGVLSSIQALAGTTKCLPSIPGISAMPWFVPTIATFRKALITLPSTWFVSSETYS